MAGPRTSIHRKLSYVVLATTVCALLITAAAMAFYDVRTFQQALVADLTAQADIVGLASAPALEFDDPESAQDYLALLRAKSNVVAAAIYAPNGSLFASYAAAGDAKFPELPELDGYRIEGGEIGLFKRVANRHEILGTVYIKARHGMVARLLGYLGIIGGVMALSLVMATLISQRMQRSVTRPIAAITSVARHVMEQRDFKSRAEKITDDEIGLLADAFNGMLTEIERRTQTLEQSNQNLEREIGERARAESALRASDDRLRALNAELEERVKARTGELEAANKDLESFSYSVSHDLRAPIRAVSGFTSLLIEDHGAELNAEARRKLDIIAKEAVRMGTLIDDLLAFSRLGRKALTPSDLDMQQLARAVFERLTQGTNGGKVIDLKLGSMPRATADQSLFEQVWANLISNAIKFSSKKDSPVIEIGGISAERENVYFVRDNGAGFDAAYRERLFGVFQRLHHDYEFPGTGVGLALVHRIVTRHGGRVWADGELDRGATFHFTVPKEVPGGGV
jgi:signal transduction histidine kinase